MNNDKRITARMVRTIKTVLLGAMVILSTSCEDFLTISPTDKIVKEDFWKSKSDVDNVVAECYRLMSQWDFTSRLIVWGELRGDNVIEGNYSGNNDVKNIMDANLLPSNGYVTWASFYAVINNCNIVLEYAPDVVNVDPDFTQGDLDVVRGQMYAIRALCHFYLVRTFKDIPLLTVAMVNDSQNLYQDQVDPITALDQCLADLYLAENLVLTSGNYVSDADNRGRITKDAVRAMIADVNLWKAAFLTYNAKGNTEIAQAQECYNECIEYCDLVLDARMAYIEDYKKLNPKGVLANVATHESLPIMYLLDNSIKDYTKRFPFHPYSMQFANGCNSLSEAIFEIQHGTVKGSGNYEVPYFYGYSTDQSKFTVGMLSASNYLVVLKGGLYKRTDFRRVHYIAAESGDANADKFGIVKYGYTNAAEDRKNLGAEDNYIFGKVSYSFLENNTEGGMRFFDKNVVNWNVYRMADIVLMKAEALALRNSDEQDLTQAYQLVEALYNRSQTGYKLPNGSTVGKAQDVDFLKWENYNTQDKLLRLVLDERQREFAFEGKRWFDLVRWALRDADTGAMLDIMVANKYESNHDQYKSKMATINSLFFPIAEREINTSDGHLTQNDAYETSDTSAQN